LLADLGREWIWPSVWWRIRREQVRAPLNLDIVVLLQSIDPNLADIAEWSDVVGKHHDRYWLTGLDFHSRLLSYPDDEDFVSRANGRTTLTIQHPPTWIDTLLKGITMAEAIRGNRVNLRDWCETDLDL